MTLARRIVLAAVPALALAASAGPVLSLPPGSTPREIELGREASEDIAKAVRLVDDPEELAKLQAMLDEIAAATDRPDIKYVPHIVASPSVNAFVIPGGWVYITTGLLDSAESDDEIAGVLAHEIAHNVDQHAIRAMREAPKGLGLLQLASIAALILGKSPEAAVLAGTAANTITAAVLNGNTIEMEKEADHDGIGYLTRTHYNPTGFLTFMERLAASSGKFVEEDLGIYRTHPMTRDRVEAARERLEEFGVPILRRLVTENPEPEARRTSESGREATEIVYGDERLLLLAGHDDDRAARAVETIAFALDHELDAGRIKVLPVPHGVVFQPEDGPSLFLGKEDGEVSGNGEAVAAGRLRERIDSIVRADRDRNRANTQLY